MTATVLLVDDDTAILQALVRSFRKEPFHLRTATSGAEALRILAETRIDLIISDWNMPAMNGGELLAKVARQYPNCIRIMLTGQPSLQLAMAAINNGEVYRFLTKPYDAVGLAKILREALAQRSERDAVAAARLQPTSGSMSGGAAAAARVPGSAGGETAQGPVEVRIRQAQKMVPLGRLASGICHDFNNLLTVINGYCDLLLANPSVESSIQASIRQIKGAGERAAALTGQVLMFSRQKTVTPSALNLNEVIGEFTQILKRIIGEHIEFTAAIAPQPIHVFADRGQLEQVVMNLIVNACDAMPLGGALTVQTAIADGVYANHGAAGQKEETRWAVLSVIDSGCGMDEATRQLIFEPFFTTKKPGKGTGLGLATVQEIAYQLGCRIEVESAPGQGTCFRLFIPRLAEATAIPSQPFIPCTMPGGTETVLLVEDADDVRGLARSILSSVGYKVVEARNAREALTLWDQLEGPIHILVTDVVMPGICGPELADRLAQRCPALKILTMSGYGDRPPGAAAAHRLDAPVLRKPFLPVALARRVREALDAIT
jgi:two-component system, cell cycle sensor histidine kinase and response regulator CckA